MTEYGFLEGVLNLYNPLLFVIAFIIGMRKILRREIHRIVRLCSLLSIGLGYVYGLYFLDRYFEICKQFNVNYSIHTAFAIAVSIAVSSVVHWSEVLLVLFCFYVVGMLFIDFHTVEDIVFTSLIIAVPLFVLQYIVIHKTKGLVRKMNIEN